MMLISAYGIFDIYDSIAKQEISSMMVEELLYKSRRYGEVWWKMINAFMIMTYEDQ